MGNSLEPAPRRFQTHGGSHFCDRQISTKMGGGPPSAGHPENGIHRAKACIWAVLIALRGRAIGVGAGGGRPPPYPPIQPQIKWLRRGFFPTSEPQGRAAEGLTRLPAPWPVISHLYRRSVVLKCHRGSLNAHFMPRGCYLDVRVRGTRGKFLRPPPHALSVAGHYFYRKLAPVIRWGVYA